MNRIPHALIFVMCGGLATACHWLTAVAAVKIADTPPLLGNTAGWLLAFVVSFTAHSFITFRGHPGRRTLAALRFFVISAMGFTLNYLMSTAALKWTSIPYEWSLGLILMLIAALTYFASRCWAFR